MEKPLPMDRLRAGDVGHCVRQKRLLGKHSYAPLRFSGIFCSYNAFANQHFNTLKKNVLKISIEAAHEKNEIKTRCA